MCRSTIRPRPWHSSIRRPADRRAACASPDRAIDINPNDIESVEILKGAAAGAVYGARAGQGVILITTKRGRVGETRYSARTSLSFDTPDKYPKLQRVFGQGDGGVADSACVVAQVPDCYASADSWGPQLSGVPTFDHSNELYQTGHLSDNTITASGGTERTTFYLSGGYLTQSGTVIGPNDFLHRATVRLKADHALSDKFKIGGNIQYANTNQGATQKGFNYASIPWTSWLTPPDFNDVPYLDPVTGQHRSYQFPYPSGSSANSESTRGYDNPFFSAATSVSTTTTNRAVGGVNANYTATDWLRFDYNLGLDYSHDSRLQGEAQGNSQTFDPGGQVLTLDLEHFELDHTLLATANYKVHPGLEGTVTLGQNLNVRDFNEFGNVGDVLLAPAPYSLNNTATQRQPTSFETHVRNAGIFGQATLDVADQLYLKAGLRYDGSSTFGTQSQFHSFPSASAAWQFTKALHTEDSWLSFGKLRIAYGEVGTEPGPYVASKIYTAGGQIPDAYGGLFLSSSQGGVGGLSSR